MGDWFRHSILDTGRLPLFCLLVSFVLTFLFIRFSVRMIRAQVSWWPGNVTPGGVHVHHAFFGMMMMAASGLGFVAVAGRHTPVADVVLACVFGIGAALVLDEFALILHLEDVYWSEEGRSSIDAVFVAIAVIGLFLVGLRPLDFSAEMAQYRTGDLASRIAVLIGLTISLLLVVITLLKGKIWTGLAGLFFPPLQIVGAVRLARPNSPWARWRYVNHPRKRDTAMRREIRYRQPLMRAKIAVQEAVAGSFGVPESAAPRPPAPPTAAARVRAPNALLTSIRWWRTRRRLAQRPVWRVPVILIVVALIAAPTVNGVDELVGGAVLDAGDTVTLLGVIAGAMATLTGLVFAAVTLAMQFGASQISVRVIPMLQQDRLMRWSFGVFLATFVFSAVTALDMADEATGAKGLQLSTNVAVLATVVSAILFIALVARVGTILNSARLLRWIGHQGRDAILRLYPTPAEEAAPAGDARSSEALDTALGVLVKAWYDDSPATAAPAGPHRVEVVRLRETPRQGRVLLAINLPGIQRLAINWGTRIDLMVGVGDHVPHNAALFTVHGPIDRVRAYKLQATLVFGDTHRPSVSPVAALQSLSDIALKALSPAINDPGRAVQALDHVEDLLLMLAPRVRAEQDNDAAGLVSGYRRTWNDYVAVGTDEIRHYAGGAAQVQRRMRAVLENLVAQCPPSQHPPLTARLIALDEQVGRDWPSPLDRNLAAVPDRQGYGSEAGIATQSTALRFSNRPARAVDAAGAQDEELTDEE